MENRRANKGTAGKGDAGLSHERVTGIFIKDGKGEKFEFVYCARADELLVLKYTSIPYEDVAPSLLISQTF